MNLKTTLLVIILYSLATTVSATSVSPRSDDFNNLTLNTSLWEKIDPKDDSEFTMEGTDTANAFLTITVPCCVTHSPYTPNNAPRIMQNISNVDFEIEAKFQSLVTEKYQEEGFIIEESPGNYIRIDLHSDGTNLYSYAGTFLNNLAIQGYNTRIHSKFTQPVPLYLKVNRSGDNWSYRYSYNGITWTDVRIFPHNMSVTKVGVFIGNENTPGSLTPKFTGNIDYFFNTASPIPDDIPDTTPPVINVWYGLDQRFGHLGTPQTWINIMGNVSDSSSAVIALNYSLNDGPAHQLVLGKDNLRLENTNDFNIEEGYTNFNCGDNHIDLSANDSVGNVNNTIVNISYSCGVNWLMPYTVDWSTVSDIQDVAQVVDGQWIISNGKVTPIPGYDRIIAMGNMTWKNYTVTVPITLNSAMTVPGANFGIALRWKEHVFWSSHGAYPREGWYPLGAIAGYFDSTSFGGKRLALLGNKLELFANDTTAKQLEVGKTYNFKASAQTVGTNQVFSLKVWDQGTEEPIGWMVSGNAPSGALTQGSILFTSYYSDVSFGNVTITNLDTPANIPPSSNPGSYTGTVGIAVSFDGSGSFDPDGSIVFYEWDFGDGNSSTGVNPTHIYAQNGTYAVSLKVTDNGGLNATNSTTAVIYDVTAPSGVTGLTNASYGPNYINWTWSDPADPDFDYVEIYLDGSFKENVAKGIQFYNATGLNSDTSYTIGLKSVDTSDNVNSSMVTDVASTASLPDTTRPEWSPMPSDQTLELGTAFDYTVAATDPLSITYSINDTVNFAINSNSTGGQITNATTLSKGIYGLIVTATDASGNANSEIITVTVSDTIAPEWRNPVPSDQTIQVGTSFSYDVNADDQSVITYEVNNTNFEINSATGHITNNTALSAGIYSLNITATDDSGNLISRIITVTVQAESTYSASGYVFDNNDAALADVSIQNGSHQAISSEDTGYYEITGLLNGSYNFSYTKDGFDTGYSIITISGSDIINEDKILLDTTPPAPVTGLLNDTPTRTTINLSWDPTDGASFYQIFRDSAIVGATRNTYWNDTDLSDDTTYQYKVRANDSYNNWGLNSTVLSIKTAPVSDNTPPASVTNLMNVSYAMNYINWTWFDPAEPDFDHVEVYLNGSFKGNIAKGIRFYNATGLNSDTSYTIGLKSVDTSGNVNSSMVNHSARTARNTITSPVNLIGNNMSEIVLEKQAMIDITANNSSVSGYITLTVDTNITRLNESVSIANSTFGILTGEKALNYVEIDSIGINKSNISSVNLTMFYSDEDISGLDENSLKIYWWNGSTWKPLDPKGKNYSNENGPIVIDIRRNQTANRLTVQLNHFSTFALVGTQSTPTKPCNYCGGSSGGSSGGGGGGSSGENASNIELIEKYDLQISRDVTTSYRFTHMKNPVMFVNITGNTSLGIITVSEEVLKSTSSLVNNPPGGLVYKNFNIWVGTSGYATPRNIKEASIKFRVDNTWMNANSIAANDIVLVKWNGDSWIELETSVLSKDDTNTFFEGKTITFSPFAIAVKMGGVAAKVPSPEISQQTEVKSPQDNQNSSQPAQTAIITWFTSSGMPAWSAILIILIITILIVMLYFKWMNK